MTDHCPTCGQPYLICAYCGERIRDLHTYVTTPDRRQAHPNCYRAVLDKGRATPRMLPL